MRLIITRQKLQNQTSGPDLGRPDSPPQSGAAILGAFIYTN